MSAIAPIPPQKFVSPLPDPLLGGRVIACSTAAELAATPGLRSDDVPDIELAALAIEHGLVLASHDHGFRRFTGLRTIVPIEIRR